VIEGINEYLKRAKDKGFSGEAVYKLIIFENGRRLAMQAYVLRIVLEFIHKLSLLRVLVVYGAYLYYLWRPELHLAQPVNLTRNDQCSMSRLSRTSYNTCQTVLRDSHRPKS
jgi:hypothetical protein